MNLFNFRLNNNWEHTSKIKYKIQLELQFKIQVLFLITLWPHPL